MFVGQFGDAQLTITAEPESRMPLGTLDRARIW